MVYLIDHGWGKACDLTMGMLLIADLGAGSHQKLVEQMGWCCWYAWLCLDAYLRMWSRHWLVSSDNRCIAEIVILAYSSAVCMVDRRQTGEL